MSVATAVAGRAAPRARPVDSARRVSSAVPAPVPVQLTRRGRLVITLLLLALLLVLFTLLGQTSAATSDAAEQLPTRTVVVDEGDTLWAIASQVAEPGEVREVVHQIEQVNSLPSASVLAGQKLAVPTR